MVCRQQNAFEPVADAYDSASEEDQNRIRVILVMGVTGSGKSTFIKNLTNDNNIVTDDGLPSRK